MQLKEGQREGSIKNGCHCMAVTEEENREAEVVKIGQHGGKKARQDKAGERIDMGRNGIPPHPWDPQRLRERGTTRFTRYCFSERSVGLVISPTALTDY